MKTNDEGINRRNIPVNFMDYIAQKHGYDAFADVKKKSHYARISAEIKEQFSQTTAKVRKPYEHAETLTRRPKETALQFAIRVDDFCSPAPKSTLNIPGDAETLSLSDLKPETVKQVAAELLGQEIEKAEALRKVRNLIEDEVLAFLAQRWGRMLLDAIPKKHAYPETGPEQIIDRSGKTRTAPDLLIETNQQWSPEELKNWLKAQPGNTQQERKSYFNPDLTRPYREPVAGATSNDGVNWSDDIRPKYDTPADTDEVRQAQKRISRYGRLPVIEIKIRNYTPENWPAAAPPYLSAEGWEYEKAMKYRQLKSMLTIEWLEKQKTEKHALVAQRLREILAA